MTTKPVPTIICRAGSLVETLAESCRVVVHQQLDELIAAYQEPIPYAVTEAVTEAGLRAELDEGER